MFECRENMGDERTEEGKNRSHLSTPSDHLSFCSPDAYVPRLIDSGTDLNNDTDAYMIHN